MQNVQKKVRFGIIVQFCRVTCDIREAKSLS